MESDPPPPYLDNMETDLLVGSPEVVSSGDTTRDSHTTRVEPTLPHTPGRQFITRSNRGLVEQDSGNDVSFLELNAASSLLQEFRAFVADQKKKTETVVHTLPPASQVHPLPTEVHSLASTSLQDILAPSHSRAPLYNTTLPTVGHSTWIPAGNLPIAQGPHVVGPSPQFVLQKQQESLPAPSNHGLGNLNHAMRSANQEDFGFAGSSNFQG